MLGRAFFTMALALVAGFATLLFNAKPVVSLPSGFSNQAVTSVPLPTALAFTPDGRLLVTSKSGQLWTYERGRKTKALDLRDPNGDASGSDSKVCSNAERGLLGVAVDPDFEDNHYVYLYYTYKKHGVCPDTFPINPKYPVNRVSRFVMSGGTVAPGSEKPLIDNIPSPKGNHNAGDLHFGKEKYLYVSVGDGGCDYKEDSGCGGQNDASRDRNTLLGKILRVGRGGGIPATNPYTDPDTSARCAATGGTEPQKFCQETFARGLRNPFRMAFDPDAAGTSFRIHDVGQNAWEEIDTGKRKADYAWNFCEGRHDNPHRPGSMNCALAPFTLPIHEYSHNTGCRSITGGAFVPNAGSWPNSYDNAYLFSDIICDKIFMLKPKSGGGFARTLFETDPGAGGPVAMTFGPHGSDGTALYYTTFANGGLVRRIAFGGI
jgi:glucose/arabinose dehydrogenase